MESPNIFREKFKKFIRYCTATLFLKSILTQSSSDADIPQLCEKLAIQAARDNMIDPFEPSLTPEKASQLNLNERIRFNRLILDGNLNIGIDGQPCDQLEKATSMLKENTSKLNHLVLLYTYSFSNQNGTQTILQKSTIEHILPQKWEAHYGTQWLEECNNRRTLVDDYVEHIGNKIILARERNIRASDRDFAAKLKIYSDDSASNSKKTIELEQFIANHNQSKSWRKSDVDKRSNEMISVIIDYIRKAIEDGIA